MAAGRRQESLSSGPNFTPRRSPVVQPAPLLQDVHAAQFLARPVQPHLDRALRDAEPAGDRALGQVLLVAHLQQLALLLAQPVEGGVEVGELDRGKDLLVLLALPLLDRRGRVGPHAGVLAEGLVSDDRRQPLVAAVALAQGRAPTPGAEQSILGYVLGFARIARVAIRQTETDLLRFPPLPAIVVPVDMALWSADQTNLHKW